jgi:hypothetical protein
MNNSQAQITLGTRHRTKKNKTKKHMTEHNSDEQHGITTKKQKLAFLLNPFGLF